MVIPSFTQFFLFIYCVLQKSRGGLTFTHGAFYSSCRCFVGFYLFRVPPPLFFFASAVCLNVSVLLWFLCFCLNDRPITPTFVCFEESKQNKSHTYETGAAILEIVRFRFLPRSCPFFFFFSCFVCFCGRQHRWENSSFHSFSSCFLERLYCSSKSWSFFIYLYFCGAFL